MIIDGKVPATAVKKGPDTFLIVHTGGPGLAHVEMSLKDFVEALGRRFEVVGSADKIAEKTAEEMAAERRAARREEVRVRNAQEAERKERAHEIQWSTQLDGLVALGLDEDGARKARELILHPPDVLENVSWDDESMSGVRSSLASVRSEVRAKMERNKERRSMRRSRHSSLTSFRSAASTMQTGLSLQSGSRFSSRSGSMADISEVSR